MKTVLQQIAEKTSQNERTEREVIRAEIVNPATPKSCIKPSV
jgi:hypothetical protein